MTRGGLFAAFGMAASAALAACTPQLAPLMTPEVKKPPAPPPPEARFEILGPEASRVPIDRIGKFPEPGTRVPRGLSWSSDGKRAFFIAPEGKDEKMALYAWSAETSKTEVVARAADLLASDKPLSREEELRRERQRQRASGITGFVTAKASDAILVPLGGDLFLQQGTSGGGAAKFERLTETPEPELDPKLCANAERVVFVRGRGLFALDTRTKKETKLSEGKAEGVNHGQSDYLAQEEFDEPSGFWISPGCDRVAFLEADERAVSEEPVLGFRDGKADWMLQRFPLAGAKNPVVRIGIADLAKKKTTWVALPDNDVLYKARFSFTKDGQFLLFQTLDRKQQKLTLWRVEAASGKATAVFSPKVSPTWIDFGDYEVLPQEKGDPAKIAWLAEREGHRHLQVIDVTAGAAGPWLTEGAWDVEQIAHVDPKKKEIYFIGTVDGPLDRQLYRMSLAGGATRTRLTTEPGWHAVSIASEKGLFADTFSAADRAPQVAIKSLTEVGKTTFRFDLPEDPDVASMGIRTPEPVEIKGPSGDTLYGALLKPRHMSDGVKYPVIVMVYGGPGVQLVTNRWAPRLLWQHLADRGFVVFQLDNRGSAGRGPAFETPIYGKLGTVEMEDQLAGIEHLKKMPFVDGNRIGIYGHSYGGYMSALALLKAPGVFRAAVSASPVTDWRLYDSAYTERYMGLPSENKAGYDGSQLNDKVDALKGKLLLMHGLMDENVHFQNSATFIDALVGAKKTFDLVVFPGERHGYRGQNARVYSYERIIRHFVENL